MELSLARTGAYLSIAHNAYPADPSPRQFPVAELSDLAAYGDVYSGNTNASTC
jgi:hypothetical protein